MKIKLVFYILGLFLILTSINWVYQVVNNPAILISMVGSKQFKTSNSTWRVYRDLFEEHSTNIMTPEFLGAMAQAESGGNPIVSPQWRWRLTTNVFRIYAPASTSVGLYQYTKPTFKDAKRFCIHNHTVVFDGFILNPRSCWFNVFYSRLSPSHSIEMTSARLHYYVKRIIRKTGQKNVSVLNQQKLGAIIHLCGQNRGRRFAKAGFRFQAVPKCGSHNTRAYVDRILKLKRRF